MSRVAFIISGYGENPNSLSYKKIALWFKQKEITPVRVKIDWEYRTHEDYLKQFMDQYKRFKGEGTYLFGFSFGAMIAFMASTQIDVHTQVLGSLSPYFKEDIPYFLKSWRKFVGKKRMNVIKKLIFNKLAPKTKAKKTIIIIGSKEIPIVMQRAREAHRRIKGSKLVIASNAEHNIKQKEYLDAVHEIIKKL